MSDWNVTGSVLIACNCDWGCPCNFNAPPSRGFCQGGWCWQIERGQLDGVALDGLALSVWARWPGAIHEGNGEAVAFIDARGNDEQRRVLTRVVRGELGGPWGIFSNTYKLDGPHAATFEIEIAEHHSKLTIGDALRLSLEPMRNPVTNAETHPEIVLPEGLVVKRAGLAKSSHFELAHDIAYDHTGQYSAFGRFDYKLTAA